MVRCDLCKCGVFGWRQMLRFLKISSSQLIFFGRELSSCLLYGFSLITPLKEFLKWISEGIGFVKLVVFLI